MPLKARRGRTKSDVGERVRPQPRTNPMVTAEEPITRETKHDITQLIARWAVDILIEGQTARTP